MSLKTTMSVWRYSAQNSTHLLVLLALADFADDQGFAYPSVRALAEKCRMGERNTQAILAGLRQSGELEIRANQGPHGANLYRITILHEPVQESAGVQVSAPVQKSAGVQESAPGGAETCAKPLQKPAPKQSLNNQEQSSLLRDRAGAGDPEGFTGFWDAWPRTPRKQDRKKCAAKWARAGFVRQLPQILEHIEAMKLTKSWREGFEPAPLTYLNGERWLDGMPPADACRAAWSATNRLEAEHDFREGA